MLRIRLTRVGKKKQPHYRVVVADVEAPRDGRVVERIGYYSPLTESDLAEIDEARALYWLSVGAQPTDTVRSLLSKQGTLQRLVRLRRGESFEDLVAEYKREIGAEVAEPAPAKAPAATEEAVVAEPATESGEAYAEMDAESEAEDSIAGDATEVASDVATAVADAAGDALDSVSDAVEEVIGSVEEE